MRRGIFDLTDPGRAIAIAIGVLTLIGIASIYVTDTHYASGHDGPANALKQGIRVLAGAIVALVMLRIGYQQVSRYAYAVFVIGVVALVPLLIAKMTHFSFGGLVTPRNGAYRWIQFPGFLLQSSEFMKVAFVIALAWYLRYRRNYRRFGGLLIPFIASVLPLALILLEPDLGTALLLVPVLFVMLFMAGAKVWHLLIIAAVGFAAIPFAWSHAESYQRLRVTAVLLQSDSLREAVIRNPEDYRAVATKRQALEWRASSGYQLVHSKTAIGSGGILGQGWGKGVYVENSLLPDRHNDFIFAIIAHQWGLAGCVVVLACFVTIVVAGVRIVSVRREPFARSLGIGVITLLATQVCISVAMSAGLMPITGMTLPFVSYGGSSVLCNFIAVAMLVSVSQHRPYLLTADPFVFTREHTEELQRKTSETAEVTTSESPT